MGRSLQRASRISRSRLWRVSAAAFALLGLSVVLPGPRAATRSDRALASGIDRVASEGSESPPASGLHFTQSPTDAEFLRVGLFATPLVPVGTTTADENRALGQALLAYEQGVETSGARDEVGPLLAFLDSHPTSAWRPALLVTLGTVYRQTGHFSRVAWAWQSAWDLAKGEKEPKARALADAAVANLSQFEAYLGRKEPLQSLLQEIRARRPSGLGGTAGELVSESSRGLAEMLHMPEVSFKCGPFALSRILEYKNPSPPKRSLEALQQSHSTPEGLSLRAVGALSARVGMNYQMAYRRPGAATVVPAVAHWKVGHYAALLGEQAGRYRVGDATFGEDIRLSPRTLDEESSGYFLVPPGPLPAGWRAVGNAEGEGVWGRGNTGSNKDNGATGPGVTPAFPANAGKPCGGCTTWNVEPMVVGLSLHDRPVGYTPPLGPEIQFDIDYSQRDVLQPAVFNYGNVGRKWTTRWLSYVTDNAAVNSTVELYRRGGGNETYSFASGASSSLGGPFTQAVVTRRTDAAGMTTGFERLSKDGSVEQFGQPFGTRYFLTSVADPSGNKVTLAYDAQMRLVTLTDAAGQLTTLAYELASDPLKITKVTDPFGRSATLAYTPAGQLQSVTDVLGIVSRYTYDASDFVTALETPYGTTHFTFGDAATDPTLVSTRFLTITDALGRTSRVEFRHGAPGISGSDPGLPRGVNATNGLMHWRNTFVWNAAQYESAMSSGTLDYTKASILHWLHTNDNSTSRILESTKSPLESRVSYDYPGQTRPDYVGTSNTPLHVARLLDDSSTSLVSMQYNALGQVTQSTDPAGRKLAFTYDPNGIDLLSVTTGTDTLGRWTYNPQHLPLTAVSAGGATTSYEYNAAGQLVSATGGIGNKTTVAYDATGHLSSVTGPLPGQQYAFAYDDHGRVASATDPTGAAVHYEYDAADRSTRVTYADGTSTSYTYHLLDLASVTDRLGRTTQVTYDAEREVTQIADPLGQTVKLRYSPDGLLSTIEDPSGHVTSVARDLEGRVVTKLYADGTMATVVYEKTTSRAHSVTDALNQTKSFAYNADDTVAALTYTNAGQPTATVRYKYDPALARLLGITDGVGTTTFAYSPLTPAAPGAGLLKSVTAPVAGSKGVTDTVTFAYDALDRPVSQSIAGATETASYDAGGRLSAVANLLDTFAYGYADATERVATVSSMHGPALALSYYGVQGNQLLRELTVTAQGGSPLAHLGYRYDAGGSVTQFAQSYLGQRLQNPDGTPFAWMGLPPPAGLSRDSSDSSSGEGASRASAAPVGRVVFGALWLAGLLVWLRTGRIGPRRFAGAGAVAHVMLSSLFSALLFVIVASCGGGHGGNGVSATSVADAGPGDDAAKTDPPRAPSSPAKAWGNVTVYAYDLANRLVSALVSEGGTTPSQPQFTYAYDAASNLTSFATTGPTQATQSLAYGTTNALSTGTYDANGNPTALGATYAWDAENRLVSIVNGAHESDFTYDGLGQLVRVVEKESGKVVADHAYSWCAGTRCLERDNLRASSPLTKRYFSEGVVAAGQPYYYVSDALGSVREVVDATGTVQSQVDYDPYGNPTTIAGGFASDVGYGGYFHHAPSALSFAMHRAYDAGHGRWLNRDPVGESGGLNLYGYVDGDPINQADPAGLCPWCAAAAVGAASGAAIDLGTQLIGNGGHLGCVNWGRVATSAATGAALGVVGKAVGLVGGAIFKALSGGGAAVAEGAAAEGAGATSTAITRYWPPNNGVLGEATQTTLQPGTVIDRFGPLSGRFASPGGTPFAMRALPPEAASAPYNMFRVLQPLEVSAGTTAPAFGQIGMGLQYELPGSVGGLIKSGYLEVLP